MKPTVVSQLAFTTGICKQIKYLFKIYFLKYLKNYFLVYFNYKLTTQKLQLKNC